MHNAYDAQKIQTTSIYHDTSINAMLLTIPAGHTLREHVSPEAITLHVVSGFGSVFVDGQSYTAAVGSWFYIYSNIPHELVANQTMGVMLTLLNTTQHYE